MTVLAFVSTVEKKIIVFEKTMVFKSGAIKKHVKCASVINIEGQRQTVRTSSVFFFLMFADKTVYEYVDCFM